VIASRVTIPGPDTSSQLTFKIYRPFSQTDIIIDLNTTCLLFVTIFYRPNIVYACDKDPLILLASEFYSRLILWQNNLIPGTISRDVVKSHSGKSKSSFSKCKSKSMSVDRKSESKSKSIVRKFKSSLSPSPQVSLSLDLPPKKRQNLSTPYHLTTSTEKCMLT